MSKNALNLIQLGAVPQHAERRFQRHFLHGERFGPLDSDHRRLGRQKQVPLAGRPDRPLLIRLDLPDEHRRLKPFVGSEVIFSVAGIVQNDGPSQPGAVPRERFGEGDPVQAFVALGQIRDDAPHPHTIAGFEAQVRRAAYELVARAAVRPLIPRLGFVRDKGSHWGMAFRRGLFTVPPEDFATIEAAMREAAGG